MASWLGGTMTTDDMSQNTIKAMIETGSIWLSMYPAISDCDKSTPEINSMVLIRLPLKERLDAIRLIKKGTSNFWVLFFNDAVNILIVSVQPPG